MTGTYLSLSVHTTWQSGTLRIILGVHILPARMKNIYTFHWHNLLDSWFNGASHVFSWLQFQRMMPIVSEQASSQSKILSINCYQPKTICISLRYGYL